MEKEQQRILLRQRKLGVLLYDARLVSGASIETCARLMGVPVEQYEKYEEGVFSPSLPEIETFSFGLNIPLSHFQGASSLTTHSARADDTKLGLIRTLRQKMIGARLMQERTNLRIDTADIALVAGLSTEELEQVEAGNLPLALPQLQLIAEMLDIKLESLFDHQGMIGQWRRQKERNDEFEKLPANLQDFIGNPTNRPYIDLASRLSEMDAEKLRTIAESILEITY